MFPRADPQEGKAFGFASLEEQEPKGYALPPYEPEGPGDQHLGQLDVAHQAVANHHGGAAILPALLREVLQLGILRETLRTSSLKKT